MNEQQQKKQVELSVTIENQVHTHSFETLAQRQVPEFVDQTKQMNRQLEEQRAQLWGEQVQEEPEELQQVQQPVQQPVLAPPKETYKERRDREKREKELLNQGKQYCPNPSLYTARIMEKKQAARDNPIGPELNDDMDEEQLETALKHATETRITPDMFSNERFPQEAENIKRTIAEYRFLSRQAMGRDYMVNLQLNHSLRLKKMQTYSSLADKLEHTLTLAYGAHGLTLEGEPIKERAIVDHARSVLDEQVASYAESLRNKDEHYEMAIEDDLQRRVDGAAPEYEQRKQDFQHQYLEDHPESEWANVPGFNYPPQYEAMEKLKGLMQEHGDVYLQHKAVFDAMLEDVAHSLEAYAMLKAQGSVLDDIQYKLLHTEADTIDSKRVAHKATKEMDKIMKDSYDVIARFENVNDAMKVLLRGGKLNGLNVVVLSQFGYNAEPQFRQRMLDDASVNGVRSNWQNAELERLLQDPRVQVGDHTSQFVKRAASMLRQGDDDYNIALLNHLERIKNLGDNIPDKDFYDQTTALLKPYVDKVMNWDMERALAMRDDELADYQPQLDALFCDNMFVADLMKTKHWLNGKYSMKNDMLGDRIFEYSHRATILRALAEKSRGLALERAAKLGPLPQTAFSEFEWQNKIRGAEGIPDFIKARQDIGRRQLEAETRKYSDMGDVNSEAFKQKCKTQVEICENAKSFFVKGKFIDVEHSFQEAAQKMKDGKPMTEEETEMAKAMSRVQQNRFSLAGYTKEEAERDGFPIDIGESVFRTFDRFTESESGRQLTKEQFKKLVLDLGAGSGMQQGVTPPDELAAAREQNMRGIRQYKETIRAQYGYLAEKYGAAIENLDLKYISDHLMELAHDFANGQTDTNMLSNCPGMVDMNDPADALLVHQAEYYNMVGYAVLNSLTLAVNNGMTQEMLTDMVHTMIGSAAEHRQYLVDHKDQGPFGDRLNPQAVMKPVTIVE